MLVVYLLLLQTTDEKARFLHLLETSVTLGVVSCPLFEPRQLNPYLSIEQFSIVECFFSGLGRLQIIVLQESEAGRIVRDPDIDNLTKLSEMLFQILLFDRFHKTSDKETWAQVTISIVCRHP